jgi:tetratricopeptide (TPR) repeat protein
LLASLLAEPAWPAQWSEYRSTNFVIYTDERVDRAEELLRQFEQFRSAVLQYMNLGSAPENRRMMILMFADRDEFHDLAASKNVGGFFTPSSAGPRMVVGPQRNFKDSSVVLFHEYAHYLIREHSQVHYPRWYDEGLAEFLASAVVESDRVLLGALHPWRSVWLKQPRWVSVEQLLNPPRDKDSGGYWARFYASAWLTVHRLEMGIVYDYPDYSRQSREYLTLYNQGVDSTEAFTQAFDMSVEDMDRQLRRYRRRGRFNRVLTFPSTPYEDEILPRTLSHNEQHFVLADLAWRLGKEPEALTYLVELDPEQADAAPCLSLRAVLENHNEPTDEAMKSLLRALDMAGEDPNVLVNAGHFYLDLHIEASEDDPEKTAEAKNTEYLDRALAYLNATLDRDPGFHEAYHYLILTQKELGNQRETLEAMMGLYRLSPSDVGINVDIGTYLLDTPRPDLARPFLERAKAWNHSEELDRNLDELLEKLEQRIDVM